MENPGFLSFSDAPDALEAEVCIVGGGAMGLMAARTLHAAGVRGIVLLEAGSDHAEPELLEWNEMESVGLRPYHDMRAARTSMIGGSTNCWHGWCRPYAAEDLAGWPWSWDDLLPHYHAVHDLLGLGPFEFEDPNAFFPDPASRPPYDLGPGLRCTIRQVKAVRFLDRIAGETARLPGVRAIQHAVTLEPTLSPDGRRIEALAVGTWADPSVRKTVHARAFLFSQGGLEIPRWFLNADARLGGALLKGSEAVGRHYADSIHVYGLLRPWRTIWQVVRPEAEDGPEEIRLAWRLTPETERLLGASGALRHGNDEPDTCPMPADGRILQRFTGPDAPCFRVMTSFNGPSTPYRDSRVLLGDGLDRFGWRKGILDWRTHPEDLPRLIRLAEAFEARFLANGLGRLRLSAVLRERGYALEDGTISNGCHHLGTMRMGEDPKTSACDRDGRVHGLQNAFVAGTALFPSYAWNAPTYTALALSRLLAERLANRLRMG
jgi:choline dehydrogenase-like flavoprotein